tara:strand:+ start:27665 stop:28186 length:522 start_codon:yes stop_codon:yes gene_type:complete
MADVLFCSKDDIVRKSTMLDGNIDSDKIIPALHLAQTQYLREIIGTDLYNKFSSDITALINSGTTFPADYKNLLDDFVKPILIHLTIHEFLKTASVTVSNKGVFKHTSENAGDVSSEELKDLIQVERDRAQSYTQRFLDHMAFNAASKFPEWFSNSNEDVSPLHESYTIDWVL